MAYLRPVIRKVIYLIGQLHLNILPKILLIYVLVYPAFPANGQVRLPALFGDGMVLQRDMKLKIRGWAYPGEKISVRLNNTKTRTITGADGKWLATLTPMKKGGPFNLHIKGSTEIILNNVLIGDVWFCSGQSNMVLPMKRVKEKYPNEIASADYPEIRNFFIPTLADVSKAHEDLPPGKWMAASPSNVLGFGAAAYFFAKKLYLKYHIPIGIINSSVGGTPIKAWISAEGYKDFPKYEREINNFRDSAYMNSLVRRHPGQENAVAAGSDRKYVWAKAVIDVGTVTVWNDSVTHPVSVRYAWADNPEGANLYNKEGLPASPFETSDISGTTK